MMNEFMSEAIKEARSGIKVGDGGPFGAVVVKDGVVVGRGHNKVIGSNDPTAHGEIIAIRDAAKNLGRFELSDCELYTTCEPCPMCYAAIHWARIPVVYFGCTKNDAAELGFDDSLLNEILKRNDDLAAIKMIQLEKEACHNVFDVYEKDENKKLY